MTRLRPGPPEFTPDDLLTLPRVTSYEVRVLATDETHLGTLDGVMPGGYVKHTSTDSVHGKGQIPLMDTGQDIDWLNVRLQPWITMHSPVDNSNVERPLGMFLPALPEENWTDVGRTWSVDLTDKLGILDTDIPKSSDGAPYTYSVSAADYVIDVVRSLIEDTGEACHAILDGDEQVGQDRSWDIGETRLKIINDLLASAGYFSLWCDEWGQYRVTEYVSPAMRVPKYEGLNPFSDFGAGMMTPDYTITKGIYGVPNYYPVIVEGTDSDDPIISHAENRNPLSPFSYESRGRWITAPVASIEATSQQAADTRAQMLLAQASAVTAAVPIKHLYLPDLRMNDAVRFRMTYERGDYDMLCYVTSTQAYIGPLGLCESRLHEAVV